MRCLLGLSGYFNDQALVHLDASLCLIVFVIDHVILLLDDRDVPLDPDLIVLYELGPWGIETVHQGVFKVEPVCPSIRFLQSVEILQVLVTKHDYEILLVLQRLGIELDVSLVFDWGSEVCDHGVKIWSQPVLFDDVSKVL